MLKTLAVANYRSLRELILRLDRLNVVTGPNGSGKSNLYRALRLLASAGRGELVAQLAREGGLPSTLWAGPEQIGRAVRRGRHPVQGTVRRESVNLKLGFASDDFGYYVDLGLPSDAAAGFELDPVIKRECIWSGPVFRQAALSVDRRGSALLATDETGAWAPHPQQLATFESMMTEYVDLRAAPETSLHPDLVPPLGRLIRRAAEHAQVIVVTHNAALVSHFAIEPDVNAITLDKDFGETVTGAGLLDRPPWTWPPR